MKRTFHTNYVKFSSRQCDIVPKWLNNCFLWIFVYALLGKKNSPMPTKRSLQDLLYWTYRRSTDIEQTKNASKLATLPDKKIAKCANRRKSLSQLPTLFVVARGSCKSKKNKKAVNITRRYHCKLIKYQQKSRKLCEKKKLHEAINSRFIFLSRRSPAHTHTHVTVVTDSQWHIWLKRNFVAFVLKSFVRVNAKESCDANWRKFARTAANTFMKIAVDNWSDCTTLEFTKQRQLPPSPSSSEMTSFVNNWTKNKKLPSKLATIAPSNAFALKPD